MTAGPIGPMLVLTALAILAGAVLFFLGFRGRRLNDHPVCRRCRFDLFGLANDTTRCPECGRDITRPRAVRLGVRRRRPVMLTVGVLLLLIGIGLGGLFTWSRVRTVDWNPYKPTWLLLWETGTDNVARLDGVIGELHARWSRGELSDRAVQTLISDGLKRQGNPNTAWPVKWSNLIEDAILQGKVSKDDTLRYFQQAVKPGIDWRKRIHSGDPWAVRLAMNEDRVGDGSAGGRQLWVRRQMKTLRVGDTDLMAGRNGGVGGSTLSRGGRSSSSLAMNLSMPLGSHQVEAMWTLSIVLRGDDLAGAPSIAEWEVRQTGTVEIVPPETPLVRLVTDNAHRPALSKVVERVRLRVFEMRSDSRFMGTIELTTSPVAVAADVLVRVGDREWVIGQITHSGSMKSHSSISSGTRLTDFPSDAERVTIVLRPSVEAALRDPVIEAIWGEPIEIPDVELERTGRRDANEGGE